MKKSFVITCMILMVAVTLLGACESDTVSAVAASTKDPETVIVAEVDGMPVYLDFYQHKYNSYKQLYKQFYYIELSHDELKEMALDDIINDIIIEKKLEELGFLELTPERIAKAESYAQGEIDNFLKQHYLDEDYTEKDLEAARELYQDEVLKTYFNNSTWDELVAVAVETVAFDDAYDELKQSCMGDVKFEPNERQMQEFLIEITAEQKDIYEKDPSLYISYVLDGYTQYYVPSGVRRIRQAVLPDEKGASDILSRLQSGDITFEEAMLDYPDESMPEGGYPVISGDVHYSDEFTKAALSLENIGDVAGPITGDKGYCILQYYADETHGPVKYEDVYDAIYEELEYRLEQEAWEKVLDGWKEEMGVIIFDENLP